MATVTVDVSVGELVDKITILELKAERIRVESKRLNVRKELELLRQHMAAAGLDDPDIKQTIDALRQVNTELWEIEDEIRDCERCSDFGARFVELARAVYHTNDKRSALKRRINDLCGSDLVEEKQYAVYDGNADGMRLS